MFLLRLKSIHCLVALSLILSGLFGFSQAAEVQSNIPAYSGKIKIALFTAPQDSPIYVATQSLREGIATAAKEDSDRYQLVQYTLQNSSQVLQLLEQAADDKVQLVIGPISKEAVETVASLSYLPVPVLALNRPSGSSPAELFLSIDLSAEGEAEEIVKLAIENTAGSDNAGKNFVILSTNSPYDEKLARAFEKELAAAGVGYEKRHVSKEQLAYIKQEMRGKGLRGVLFAMSAEQASLIRPYIPLELPVFGTSYTNPMNQADDMAAKTQANDLLGLVTLEIPAVASSSPQFAKYKSQMEELGRDQRHLFALGVDAWNLGKQWLQWEKKGEFPEGLSGRLSFNKDLDSRVRRTMEKVVVKPETDTPE